MSRMMTDLKALAEEARKRGQQGHQRIREDAFAFASAYVKRKSSDPQKLLAELQEKHGDQPNLIDQWLAGKLDVVELIDENHRDLIQAVEAGMSLEQYLAMPRGADLSRWREQGK